jgi:hypothetical protein
MTSGAGGAGGAIGGAGGSGDETTACGWEGGGDAGST